MRYLHAVILILAVAIILILLSSIFPFPLGIRSYVVLSGSMEPAIKTGSVVVVSKSAEYKTDDVITFSDPDREVPVTHRIVDAVVDRGALKFITKGDANEDEDLARVEAQSIIGKVRLSIPYLGFLIEAARKPYGFAALVILPALFIIAGEVKKIAGEIKKIKSKKTPSDSN